MLTSDENVQAPEYIESSEQLERFCAAIADTGWLCVDTEFLRERTYYPQLCLIQIGVTDRVACIDPLSVPDLEPLYGLLYNTRITKVFHACSQDLEIFVHLKGAVPTPIFDTQLAAPLIGIQEQVGYAGFVEEMLGIHLDKAQARTDWSKRPLSERQLQYAANDVRYLAAIYPELKRRLEELGRLDWLQDEFAVYENLQRYCPDPLLAWQRLKGLERLRPVALANVQRLSVWRERLAIDRNLPRGWVLKDDTLLDIARQNPATRDDLGHIRGLPPKTLERYAEVILDELRQAREQGAVALPENRKRNDKPSIQEEALIDILQAQLRLIAELRGINSAVLASRKDLLELLRDEDSGVLKGWKKKVVGEELQAMRDGRRLLRIENRQLVITATDGCV
jgi:ribonuclease D